MLIAGIGTRRTAGSGVGSLSPRTDAAALFCLAEQRESGSVVGKERHHVHDELRTPSELNLIVPSVHRFRAPSGRTEPVSRSPHEPAPWQPARAAGPARSGRHSSHGPRTTIPAGVTVSFYRAGRSSIRTVIWSVPSATIAGPSLVISPSTTQPAQIARTGGGPAPEPTGASIV